MLQILYLCINKIIAYNKHCITYLQQILCRLLNGIYDDDYNNSLQALHTSKTGSWQTDHTRCRCRKQIIEIYRENC